MSKSDTPAQAVEAVAPLAQNGEPSPADLARAIVTGAAAKVDAAKAAKAPTEPSAAVKRAMVAEARARRAGSKASAAAAPEAAPAKAAPKAAEPKAEPVVLTKAQLDEATRLRTKRDETGGLTYAEIAEALSVPKDAVSAALKGLARGTTSKTGTTRQMAAGPRVGMATLDWDGFVETIKDVAGGTIAWYRQNYVMLRGDASRSQASGSLPTGTTWATVCEHGTVKATGKGAAAEQAGKDRAAWCGDCKAGKPGVVPAKAKPAAEAPAAAEPAKAEPAKAAPRARGKAAAKEVVAA